MHTRTLRHHAFITIIIIVIFIDKIFIPLILSYPIHLNALQPERFTDASSIASIIMTGYPSPCQWAGGAMMLFPYRHDR